jgi:phosphatidylethanolamine-binding protein (PEBP) family uncharacterized protein
MAMILNSSAFKQNGRIPSSTPAKATMSRRRLAWEGVPNGAKSLVLVIDDSDAPDPKASAEVFWCHLSRGLSRAHSRSSTTERARPFISNVWPLC